MVLILNMYDVIVDMTPEVHPVMMNNGVVVGCDDSVSQGYVTADGNTVYAKMGTQFQPSFYDVAKMVTVERIPSYVKPLQYKYYVDKGFVVNDDAYPDSNLGLTSRTQELEDIVLEMSELLYG